ncbi:MAG: OmpH family outer membrane protein [Tenuifilum sp.]|mgnify:CR=1 FL=1|uniref:OmpH family outer membrane protein n=1 Tax=Tenuifilum sp. TaxID=2760880 RepID=UPI001B567583|nr:OmpH family outer membrane protein [Bacteroidales bacterium]HOK61996.1 OmpH family outer membrane protein [Tenuifilum sp.]MBP9029304.1 OmpH family outer membrane protein [Bacteroidales bacterium]HOK86688.1 OmpH family outer membrane protein [Tenuifilum sp.]HON70284.1 OmpH family outer membrane protein [Tenuifilum sp.]
MKKTNLIINILFGVAIVVLFVLHFTMGSKRGDVKGTEGNAVLTEQFTAAWVNMDTLMNSYDMYFDMKKELEESGRKKEADLNAKSRSFEKEAYDFQDKVQKGLLTRSEAQQLQTNLAAKEQQLYQLRDEMRMQLAEEEQVKLRLIHNSIIEYLKEYNADKGYHLILSNTFGGPLLYGNPANDITKEVLEGLNKKYAADKKK